MFVKPVPGRQVPDPDRGGYLSEDGRTVEASQYWLRRLVDGDVIEIKLAAKVQKGVKA